MVATQLRGLGSCDPVLWHDRIVQQAGGAEVNVCEKGNSRHRARTLAGSAGASRQEAAGRQRSDRGFQMGVHPISENLHVREVSDSKAKRIINVARDDDPAGLLARFRKVLLNPADIP